MEDINDYDDMEAALERKDPTDREKTAIENLAAIYISEEQVKDKGKLLGQYKSSGFCRNYINVYEKAVTGRLISDECKTPQYVELGVAYLNWTFAEKGRELHILCKCNQEYRIRHLKNAERISCQINAQIFQGEKEVYG